MCNYRALGKESESQRPLSPGRRQLIAVFIVSRRQVKVQRTQQALSGIPDFVPISTLDQQ